MCVAFAFLWRKHQLAGFHLTSTTPAKQNHRGLTEWLLLLGVLSVVAGFIVYAKLHDYRLIDTQERERLASHTAVIEKNLTPQLRLANSVIENIIHDIPSWMQQNDGLKGANRELQVINDTLLGIRPILVIAADGNVIASSNAKLVGQNFSHREYFQTALKNPDPKVLHVSAPFQTVLNTFVISLFRTIEGPDGEFAGIVIVSVVPEYFFTLLDAVRHAPDVKTALLHGDGKLFLMAPERPDLAGKDMATPDTLFTRHLQTGRVDNVFTAPVTLIGANRMVAFRTVNPADLHMDKPLVVTASRDINEVFAAWRHDAYGQGGLFGVLMCGTSLGLLMYQRRHRTYRHLMAIKEAERERAGQALRESEERMRRFFENVPVGIFISTSEGKFIYVNPAMASMLGYDSYAELMRVTNETSIGQVLYADPSHRETVLQHVERNPGQWQTFENRYRRKDGQIIDAILSIGKNRDTAKGELVLYGIVSDITERKRAESDLRVAATAFESQEGMIITDADMSILRINRACSEITGYSPLEAIGQTPRMFSSGRHNSTFYQALWASINTTGAWKGEIWNRRKNGEVYPQWANISAVRGPDGAITNYVASFIDISHRKTAEEEINHLAFYDPLTNLPNRRLLIDRLRHALLAGSRSDSAGALFFIDVDNFKTLNDTLGHDKGDMLLDQVARRLSATVREEDTIARLGGDEFVIMMEGLSLIALDAAALARVVAEKILEAFKEPYDLQGTPYLCTVSIGIALFNRPTDTVEELLKQADLAMYQAKAAGRNTLRFFDPQMQSVVMARTELETDLREGLRQSQLLLHYQPQVDDDGRITGAEALVRWQHPVRGMIPPMEFIGLAEETGLILNLGHWVLETACKQLVAWSGKAAMAHLTVAVNVSAHQFRQIDFVEQVLAVLKSTGANPHRLKLELTESLLVSNVDEVIGKMFALKARGVGFSLDDFGTGYSSLSYLKRLPLDQLKIDQSFVRDIHVDPNDAAIAKTIVALAHSLGLGVISEGVETAAQRDFLAHAGCHAHQGYFFSRPLAIEGFEAFAMRG
jgi:diguanylate cyclase (GGDEF)-like protein/PAS domain S-box-containing protein